MNSANFPFSFVKTGKPPCLQSDTFLTTGNVSTLVDGFAELDFAEQ